jgi:hypothetical protein
MSELPQSSRKREEGNVRDIFFVGLLEELKTQTHERWWTPDRIAARRAADIDTADRA